MVKLAALAVLIILTIYIMWMCKRSLDLGTPIFQFLKKQIIMIPAEEGANMDDKKKDVMITKFIMFVLSILLITFCIALVTTFKSMSSVNISNVNQITVQSNTEVFVDINNISGAEFADIFDGVGESKAAKFEEVRNDLKGFKAPYDLVEFDVIGKSVYNKIKDSITCGKYEGVD